MNKRNGLRARSRAERRGILARAATAGLALPGVLVALMSQPAMATNYWWDSNGTTAGSGAATGTWGTSAFWNTDSTGVTAPAAVTTTNADDLFFSAGTNGTTGTVTVSGTQVARSITLEENVALTFSGGTAISLGGTGGTPGIFNLGTAAGTFSTAITLTSAATFQTSSTGAMTFTGAIGGGTNALTINTNTGGITIGSATSTTLLSGTGALNKNGTGTLTLSNLGGNAAISGAKPITINAGTLALVSTNVATTNILGTGAITIAPGATLTIAQGGQNGNTYGNTITIGAASGTAILQSTSGAVPITGAINFAAGSTAATIFQINNTNGTAGLITLSGAITGTGSIRTNPTAGGSTITISGAQNQTGSITNAGSSTSTVTLSGAIGSGITAISQAGANPFVVSSALPLNATLNSFASTGAGLFTLSGAISGTQNLTLQANAAGGITVSNAAINPTGNIINSGTGAGTTTVSGSIGANVVNVNQNANSLMILSGTNTYTGTSTATAGVMAFTTTNAIPGYTAAPATALAKLFASSGATLSVPFGGATNGVTTTDITTSLIGGTGFAAGASLGIDTTNASPTPALLNTIVISDTSNGSLGFTKTGTNALTLGNANTYTGRTAVVNGTLNIGSFNSVTGGTAASSLGAPTSVANGTINLGFTTTTGTISYTGVGETTDRVINLAGTTGGGGIDNSGTGPLVFTSAMTFTGTGAKSLLISGAANTTFTQAIAGSISTGTAPLTINKSGTGTLTLSGANTATTLVVSGGILDTGTGNLTLSNVGAATIQATANATINGAIALGGVGTAGNGADIGATVAGATLTINAVISGGDTNNIDFWSQPTGVTILNGANTFTGQVGIAGQTVVVSSLNSVATNVTLGTVQSPSSNLGAPTTVANGTILGGQLNNTSSGTLRYVGAGETTDRVVNLQGTTGSLTIDQSGTGTLKFVSNFTATGAGIKALTLQGSTAGIGELAGAVVDNSATNTTGITKAGTGTWRLSGANTFTGPTLVNGGTLVLSQGTGSGVLGNTPITINATGTLSPQGNFVVGNNATAAKGGSLTLNAGGTLNLADGAINTLSLVQNSTFVGAAATFAGGILRFDLSSSASDLIDVRLNNISGSGVATSSGSNAVVINPISGTLTPGNYTLINAAGSLSNSNFFLATPQLNVGGTLYYLSLGLSGTNEILTVSTTGTVATPSLAYWNGTTNGIWATQPGGAGTATNWSASASGSPDTFALPGTTTNVVISTNSVGTGGLSTTLDQNFTVNSLTFTGSGTSAATGATVASGTGTNTLTINAAGVNGNTAGNGIAVLAGSGANTISAGVVLGSSQAWSNSSSNTLTVSGPITEASIGLGLTIGGTGVIALTSGANAYTGPTTLSGGTLSLANISNGGAPSTLGSSSNAAANLVFNGGTLQYTGITATSDRNFTINAASTATVDVTQAGTTLTLPGATGAATTGALTKIGAGTLELSGVNTFTGATTVNAGILRITGSSASIPTVNSGGTLQIGSTNALATTITPVLAGTGVFDLFGNSQTTAGFTNVSTSTITNTGAGAGPSSATTPGSPALTDTLTVSTAATTIAALITDGPTRKTQVILNNANTATQMTTNTANTFSGGLVLANGATGTRLQIGTITGTPWGTGPIIIGQTATDRATILFNTASQTLNNPVIFNTSLGSDRFGIRSDVAGSTLAGVVTANADAVFSTNTVAGAVILTNQVTGPAGLVLDVSQTTTASTVLNVTLNNGTANPNNYLGDTVVGRTNATPTQNYAATLILGAANQIPNGAGFGNVVLNNNSATRTGTLSLNGFNETINGLSGNGTVDGGTTGTPTNTLTVGDGNASSTFSGVIRNTVGTLTVTKLGSGTLTLSGASTFSGPLNVNGGTVAFTTAPATAGPLGNSTVVNLSGGAISHTAATSINLNRPIAIGAAAGAIDVASSTGVLTIPSVTSTGGTLTKTGPGLAIIPGSTTLNTGTGAVSVVNGTLQAGFGTAGVGSINVAGSGRLSFVNSAAEALAIGGTPGALTLGGGSQLGFELNGALNDSVTIPSGGTVVAGGAITLNFFNTGTGVQSGGSYTLLSAPGGLTAGGATYLLGSAPNGFNYTIIATDTSVILNTTAYTPVYWRGGQDLSWNTLGTGVANWTTDSGGTLDAASKPIATDTVIFSATGAPTVTNTITTTLDAAFTIDSLQFSNVPTGVTGVTINPGTGGALTLKPASASGGINILPGGGNATIAAPLTLDNTLSASQTWTVTDAASTLNISGNLTIGANINKTGAGTLTLSGTNTGSGNIALAGGQLNINSASAIGSGTLSIAAGTTIDNTSGAAITLANNNAQNWAGDFTFAGSNSLNLGTGAIALTNNPTLTVGGTSTLTAGGVVSGSSRLTKAGSGVLTLNANNTFSGGLTISAGTVNLGHAGAAGTGTLILDGGTFDNTSGAGMTLANNNAINLNGTVTFTGSNSLNTGTGAVTLTGTPVITVAANQLTLSGVVGGSGGLTKAGPGTMTLSGTGNGYAGVTSVTGGTLNINGTISSASQGSFSVGAATVNVSASITGNPGSTVLTYGDAAGNSVLNFTAGSHTFRATAGGTVAGGVGVMNLTGGLITVAPGVGTGTQAVARNLGGYGYLNITNNAIYRDTTGTPGQARFTVASSGGTSAIMNPATGVPISAATAATGAITAVVYVGGTGQIDSTNAEWMLNYGLGQITVADSGKIDRTGSTQPLGLFMDTTVNGGSYGVLNLAGPNAQVIAGTAPIRFGNSTTNGSGNSGFVNVAAGTLSVGAAMTTSLPTSPTNTNNVYTSFAGGTLKATANITNWNVTTSGTSVNGQTNIYGSIDNSAVPGAPSFTGGITVDTGTFTLQLNNMTAASGAGVTQANMTVAAGSGYVGAPAVVFSSTGVAAGGSPASGYAVLNGSGGVAGIVITNPGSYTAGTVPTVSLIGGGGTGASVTLSALNTANTSGGFTKIGTGTVVVQGANNFAGPLNVNEGTFQMGNNGTNASVPSTSAINLAAGTTFAISRSNATSQATDFPVPITGAGSLSNIGSGVATLTLTNTYLGTTTVTAGGLTIGAGGTTGTFGAGAVSNVGVFTFNRTDNYTLGTGNLFTGSNAGVIAIASGTVTAVVDNQFNTSNALNFGATDGATTTPSLNLGTGGGTFGGLLNRTSSATGSTLTVPAGKTVNFTGNVQIGATTPVTASQISKLTITGGGNLNITTAAGGTVRVGGATAAVSQRSVLDLTGLNSAVINVGSTGTVAAAQPTTTNSTGNESLLQLPTPTTGILPTTPVTTITAGNLNVGDNGGHGGAAGQINTVTLGTGLTTLNVNTINVGTGIRDFGQINFAAGNGTVKLRAADGFARTAVNIGTGSANTGVAAGTGVTNNIDFTGHSADLLISTLTMGTQSRSHQYTNTFSFDTGTLDITNIVAATRTAETTANGANIARVTNATINLGGGTVNIGSISQFGDLAGNYVTATQTATENATLNVTGGTVNIGAVSGTSITMAKLNNGTSTAATTVNALINLTGGTTTIAGNVVKVGTTQSGTGAVTNNATVTLNGTSALLDMTGKNIGDATNAVVFNAQQGTLQNLNQLNGGGTFTKSGTGTLTVTGVNSWTGPTIVSGGTLAVRNGSATASTATLANTALTVNSQQTLLITSAGSPTTTVNVGNTATAGAGASLTLSPGTATNPGGNLSMSDGLLNTFNLIQEGTFAGNGLTIGGTGTAVTNAPVLTFDIGSTPGSIDVLNVTKTVSVGATGGRIAINPLGTSIPLGSYTFINAAGGLGVSGLTLATPSVTAGTTSYNLSLANSTATTEVLTVTRTATNAYWSAAIDTSWNTGTGLVNTGVTNWRTDATNNVDTQGVPTSVTNVFFSTTTPAVTSLSTTLDAPFAANSVNVLATNTAAVTIAGGTGSNSLTITGAAINGNTAGNGINVASGAGALTISAPVVLAGDQTWTNNGAGPLGISGATLTGAGMTLTVDGSIATNISSAIQTTTGGLVKNGSATTTLSGASSFTGNVTVNAGTLLAAQAGGNNTANPATSALGNPQVARNIIVNSGGTLQFGVDNTFGDSTSAVAATIVVNSGGTVTANTVFTTLGPVQLNGGTLTGVGGAANLQGQMYSLLGTVTVGGSSASTVSGPAAGGTTFGAYHLAANTTFNVADATGSSAADLVVSGTLVDRAGGLGAGGLTKAGAGTLTLSAANTYTGTTTVAGGTLLAMNSTGSATGTGNVQVSAGAALGGNGVISGGVTVAATGKLSPGTSPGVLTVGGSITLVTASTLEIELGGNTPGNGAGFYDQVVAGGPLDVTNAILSAGSVDNYITSDPLQAFFLMAQPGTTPVAGTFKDTNGNTLAEGASFLLADGYSTAQITYQANWTGTQAGSSLTGGNDVALYNVNIVPEPTTMAALAVAATGLLARRRRRSR